MFVMAARIDYVVVIVVNDCSNDDQTEEVELHW